MPLGLQIVGFSNEDEKVLGLMKVLESKIDFKVEVPTPIFELIQEIDKVKNSPHSM